MSSSSELNSFLLIMCIDAPESTTNSRTPGLLEVGASITLASIFSKSHASLRALLSWCKVSSCDLASNFGAQGLRS